MGWRDVLPVHPAANMLPLMSTDELKELGEDIMKNGLIVGIVLWQATKDDPWYLIDGRNRLDARELVGLPVLDELGRWLRTDLDFTCTRLCGADPYDYVLSANLHRRQLSREQKRGLIGELLKARPDKSDRQIAREIGADGKTVADVRRDFEGRAEIPHAATRLDSKGRQQPAKKAKLALSNYAEIKQGDLPFTPAEPRPREDIAQPTPRQARSEEKKAGFLDGVRDHLVDPNNESVLEIFFEWLTAKVQDSSPADREALLARIEVRLADLRPYEQFDLKI